MSNARIIALAGSTRKNSFNAGLLAPAIEGARAAGAEVTVVDMRDYPLPLFDQDFEQSEGAPENAVKLKELFIGHNGLLIASPEYNSSITPLLKNTIDWVSRPAPDEPMLAAYQGKVAAIMSASPGGMGGMRGLVHLRSILSNIGVIVIPDQVSVSRAMEVFDDNGNLTDDRQRQKISGLGATLATTVDKLAR